MPIKTLYFTNTTLKRKAVKAADGNPAFIGPGATVEVQADLSQDALDRLAAAGLVSSESAPEQQEKPPLKDQIKKAAETKKAEAKPAAKEAKADVAPEKAPVAAEPAKADPSPAKADPAPTEPVQEGVAPWQKGLKG